jgi:Tfp pilus assembly protein PilW
MQRRAVRQRGATIVELLVAMPIAALIMAGVAGILFQLSTTYAYTSNTVQCGREVQRAGAAISQDALQAQSISDTNYSNPGTVQIVVAQDVNIAGTEVFIVEWADWNNNVRTVTYSLVPISGSSLSTLQRTVQVNGTTTGSSTAAEHIDSSIDQVSLLPLTRFECTSTEKQSIRVTVTSSYGQESATRMYEIRPRSMVQ